MLRNYPPERQRVYAAQLPPREAKSICCATTPQRGKEYMPRNHLPKGSQGVYAAEPPPPRDGKKKMLHNHLSTCGKAGSKDAVQLLICDKTGRKDDVQLLLCDKTGKTCLPWGRCHVVTEGVNCGAEYVIPPPFATQPPPPRGGKVYMMCNHFFPGRQGVHAAQLPIPGRQVVYAAQLPPSPKGTGAVYSRCRGGRKKIYNCIIFQKFKGI